MTVFHQEDGKMERFASAYGRALFPGRYASRDGMITDGRPTGSGQPMTLVPGGLELAMGAGIYRVVGAVEELLDGLRQRAAGWRAKPERGLGTTPVGCG
jgi:hypothetical protein